MIEDFKDRGIYLTEDEYRTGLRSLFPEGYQEFSDEQLEDILYDKISRMSPAESEGFLDGIGDFFKKQVAPIAIAALPAVATAVGTIYGGPAGGAAGSALGGFAANAISGATGIKPNQGVANIAQGISSIAGGNIQGAIPNIINASRDVGNLIQPGAGNKVAGIASNVAQAGTAIAGRNYQGAIPNIINAGRDVGNVISPGAGNTFANIGQAAQGLLPALGLPGGGAPNQAAATGQLLSFLRSTPFLQSMLSTIATGNIGTGLQIPTEDGSVTNTNYLEMLESLKYLTENAIIEADNYGFSSNLPIESEADKDAYIEALIENVSAYENSLLPNYDNITYN